MREEILTAGCHICVAVIGLGFLITAFATSKAMVIVAFILMAIGIGAGMVLAALLEYTHWTDDKKNELHQIEERDRLDIKAGRFNYILEDEDSV